MITNPRPAWRSHVADALALALTLAVALALGGCAKPAPAPTVPVAVTPSTLTSAPAQLPTTSAEPTSTFPSTTAPATPVARANVRVYFARGEFLGVGAARTVTAASPAKGAMLQLLAGPTSAEKAWGLGTEIPAGTALRSLSIGGGIATIDLSKRFEAGGGTLTMQLRIAQVVDTLTQFAGVNKVAFRIGGRKATSIGGEGIMVSPPVGRADFASALPAIMLEDPPLGANVESPVRLRGSADVYEGQFTARVTDAAGKVIADKPITATSGTGARGTFDALVPFKVSKHGKGWITVFEPSAKDGTPTNVVKIRVYL